MQEIVDLNVDKNTIRQTHADTTSTWTQFAFQDTDKIPTTHQKQFADSNVYQTPRIDQVGGEQRVQPCEITVTSQDTMFLFNKNATHKNTSREVA